MPHRPMRPEPLPTVRVAAGFTLVELLVVAVIAVAMVAVAAPLFGGGLQRAGLRQDAVELASTLRYARNRAVTSGRPTSVRLDLDERSYAVAGEPRSETRLDDDYAIRVTYAELAGQDDEQAELRFFPDGSSTGGEVLITLRGSGWAVQVEWLTGRVSILEARGVGDA